MSDLINDLRGEPNSTRLIIHRSYYNNAGLLVGMEAIKELESEDVVEVVRCKDCTHYFTNDLEKAKNHGAECTMMARRTVPNDFCSYGEPRTHGKKV